MEIKTRYNIGQKVYFYPKETEALGLWDEFWIAPPDELMSGKIEGIYITRDNKIYYRVNGCLVYEKNIYTFYFKTEKGDN